jgi:hypothetical protein
MTSNGFRDRTKSGDVQDILSQFASKFASERRSVRPFQASVPCPYARSRRETKR